MKDSAAPQREKVRQAARLMILAGAGLTLLAFMLNRFAIEFEGRFPR